MLKERMVFGRPGWEILREGRTIGLFGYNNGMGGIEKRVSLGAPGVWGTHGTCVSRLS